MKQYRGIWITVCLFLITGCTDHGNLAPVVQSHWLEQNKNQTTHRVRPGETLYAIAFRYDKDYRQLAQYNHLYSPYSLRVGQIIRLPHLTVQPVRNQYPSAPRSPVLRSRVHPSISSSAGVNNTRFIAAKWGGRSGWYWPTQGRVVTSFIPAQGKKGIDIAGMKGNAVYASAAGVVAYAGTGLVGYGNLIIIKHNNQYLTAYGNNSRNLVHEGQRVNAGQKIADVGLIDRRFWGVHFEIRQSGQPVNPLNYLK